MKLFKKTLAALATVGALTGATSANAYLTNWYLDADGAGAGAAVKVSEYVDLNGNAYIQNTFSSATDFTFNEVGTFISLLADSSTFLGTALNATFVASGSANTTSGLTFTPGGTLTISSGANTIGTFTLVMGQAALNNAIVPNGTVSLEFQVDSLMHGYFFKDAALTQDMADDPSTLLAFGSTNASLLTSWSDAVNTGLTTLWNANYTPTIAGISSNGQTELVLSNNGQFRLPEPTSLALVGLALVGLGGLRRRETK